MVLQMHVYLRLYNLITDKTKNIKDHKFYQNYVMPINKEVDFVTDKDQNLNEDYCIYCFKDRAFTQDYTMTEMIEDCLIY